MPVKDNGEYYGVFEEQKMPEKDIPLVEPGLYVMNTGMGKEVPVYAKSYQKKLIDPFLPQEEDEDDVQEQPKPKKAKFSSSICSEESMMYGKLRGLMVFYINTKSLANDGQVLDFLDKIKAQYYQLIKRLTENGIEVMWLPVHGNCEMKSEYFSFS